MTGGRLNIDSLHRLLRDLVRKRRRDLTKQNSPALAQKPADAQTPALFGEERTP